MFGESSSEDEDGDCTGHCRGHKGNCYRADGGNNPGNVFTHSMFLCFNSSLESSLSHNLVSTRYYWYTGRPQYMRPAIRIGI